MRKYIITLLLFALVFPMQGNAQKRKAMKKNNKVEVVENPLITQMLDATQKVLFIDSMVVPKSDFYSHIPLSPECGFLLQKGGVGQYTSELGDHRVEAMIHQGDTAAYLVTSDFIGGEWTSPVPVKGIGDDDANYPYVMPDGTTLYYAQKGEKSIGGYDIFVTRYNAENGSFLRPENIGMPFASEANDYLYVIDEPMQLGYFVTDRRQPEDTVCIYVFVPSTSRHVYQSEAYTPEQLRSLAAINRIADTWSDGSERRKAMERLTLARQTFDNRQVESSNNVQQLSELEAMRHKAEKMRKALAEQRKDYSIATPEAKDLMKESILKDEKELEELLLQIRQKEKEERNKTINSKL